MIPASSISGAEPASAQIVFRAYVRLALAAIAIAGACLARAQEPTAQGGADDGMLPPIGCVGDIWEAQKSGETSRLPRPLRLDLTILAYDPIWQVLWAVDHENDDIGQYVPIGGGALPLKVGQRVVIEGEIVPQVGLESQRISVALTAENVLPQPLAELGRLENVDELDVRYVELDAYVEEQTQSDPTHVFFDLLAYDKKLACYMLLEEGESAPYLKNGFARFRGTLVLSRGSAGEPGGLAVWVSGAGGARALNSPLQRAFSEQATPIDSLSKLPAGAPARVIGIVHAREAGTSIALRDDTGQLILHTQQSRELQRGVFVEAVGFPARRGLAWTLEDAVVRPLGSAAPARLADSERLEGNLLLAEQVLRLPSAEAAKALPVHLTGVVTYSDPGNRFIYLADSSGGIRIELDAPHPWRIAFGAAVNVLGRTARGEFAPFVRSGSIALSGSMPLPPARKVSLEQASSGLEESQWIDMTGHLRAIEREYEWTKLLLATSMGEFEALLADDASPEITAGSTVRIRGVSVSELDANGRPTSVRLLVSEASLIETIEAAPADPFSRPPVPIASLQEYQALRSWTRLTQVQGVVVHHRPGRYLIVSDGESTLRALSRQSQLLRPGDTVDVVGLPGRDGSSFVLREAVYRKTGRGPEPQPVAAPRDMAIDPELDGRLVRLEGLLISLARAAGEARLLLQSGDAAIEVACEADPGPAAEAWLPDSLLSIVGVYSIDHDEFGRPLRASLQLRSAEDVSVLKGPSWWTAGRALGVAGLCLGSLCIGLAWATSLRRRVAQQTELIRAQFEKEALLEARHREIVTSAGDFIFTLDLEGRFTSFNPAGETITGYSRLQSKRMTIFELLEPRAARRARAALRGRLATPVPAFTLEIIRKDGARRWVETGAGFVRHDGVAVSVYGVMRDVTARVQVEEELRRARDAAEANTQAKAAFLATMSHELRSPMNGIIGMTSLMLETKLDAEQRDFMETVRSSSQSLLTLLNDILEFSRAEASKLSIDSEVFDFGAAVDHCVALVSPSASAKQLELTARVDPALPRHLVGDGGRLRQVLLNLLNNAVKFTDQGRVGLDVIVERQDDSCAELRIEISDTGIGIDPQMQERLFTPFVQADASFARRHGGMGLGLAICRQIVELMGGSIGAESEAGRGSTFWVKLRLPKPERARPAPPARHLAPPAEPAEEEARADVQALNLLIVDDMPVNQRVARLQLKRLGYQADVASNGREALELASRKRYDVVFMDCQMPEMDGFEATRRLRDDPANERLYIVALTANAMAGDRERCLDAGMDDYISKPSTAARLKEAIERFSMHASI